MEINTIRHSSKIESDRQWRHSGECIHLYLQLENLETSILGSGKLVASSPVCLWEKAVLLLPTLSPLSHLISRVPREKVEFECFLSVISWHYDDVDFYSF